MKLEKVKFSSFRSLADVTLMVTHACMAFVGLNESGKTNLLTGIRALNDYTCTLKDKCRVTGDVPSIDFHFQLDAKDNSSIESVIKKWTAENTLINFDTCFEKGLTLTDVERTRGVSKSGEEEKSSAFTLNVKPKKPLMILKKEFQSSSDTITINTVQTVLSKALVVEKEYVQSPQDTKYLPYTNDLFKSLVWDEIIKALNGITPDVVYWQFDSKYLIPSEITYDDFLDGNDPRAVCVPLYNIFLLANSLDIYDADSLAAAIEEWKTNASKRKTDTLIIKSALNQHVKEIWKEYDQEFDINLEADRITVHITDPQSPSRGYYEMEQRSQGFLSFVSFLLTISVETKFKMLENYILILDEPETHLHPSGVRFMRNELLKIAHEHGNHVFFATHSIFMVDRRELTRHVIVKKQHEKTTITPATKNNLIQEAVLYSEGFGTSSGEFAIGINNIVFEGDLDRRMFEFCNGFQLKKKIKFKNYESLVGGGTNNIEKFFRTTMPTPDSHWVVILDKDLAGRNLETYLKTRHTQDFSKYYKTIFYGDRNGLEIEDLLPIELIQNAFDEAIKNLRGGALQSIALKHSVSSTISSQIEMYKTQNKFEVTEVGQFEEVFKDKLKNDVEQKLHNLEQENKKIADRAVEFKKTFPAYYSFFMDIQDK